VQLQLIYWHYYNWHYSGCYGLFCGFATRGPLIQQVRRVCHDNHRVAFALSLNASTMFDSITRFGPAAKLFKHSAVLWDIPVYSQVLNDTVEQFNYWEKRSCFISCRIVMPCTETHVFRLQKTKTVLCYVNPSICLYKAFVLIILE